MTLRLIFVAACAILTAQSGRAQPQCPALTDNPIEQALRKGLEASGGVTSEIREAQGLAYAKYDKELNVVYQAVLGRLPEGSRAALIEAQRAWLKYRDQEAQFLWSQGMFGEGGTLGPVVVSDRGRESLRFRLCELQLTLKYLSAR